MESRISSTHAIEDFQRSGLVTRRNCRKSPRREMKRSIPELPVTEIHRPDERYPLDLAAAATDVRR